MLALDPNLISSDISAEGATMGDVLIRDVPDDVLTALEGLAARLGLSRSEYIRRRLAQLADRQVCTRAPRPKSRRRDME